MASPSTADSVPSGSMAAMSKAIRRWAARDPLIYRVWIFGSRARSDARLGSDLDIAIELEVAGSSIHETSATHALWTFNPEWQAQLQAFLPFKVQLEQYIEGQTPIVERGVAESSVLVYQKGSSD